MQSLAQMDVATGLGQWHAGNPYMHTLLIFYIFSYNMQCHRLSKLVQHIHTHMHMLIQNACAWGLSFSVRVSSWVPERLPMQAAYKLVGDFLTKARAPCDLALTYFDMQQFPHDADCIFYFILLPPAPCSAVLDHQGSRFLLHAGSQCHCRLAWWLMAQWFLECKLRTAYPATQIYSPWMSLASFVCHQSFEVFPSEEIVEIPQR